MSTFNCENYDSEICPKQMRINIEMNDSFDIVIVGCWGVYCEDGDITIENYQENEELATKVPTNLKVKDFFEYSTVTRGQNSVINSIKKIFKNRFNSLFLAGDNIYEYSKVSLKLKNLLEFKIKEWQDWFMKNKDIDIESKKNKFNKIFPTKKIIKKDRGELREMFKNLDIDLQLNSSFQGCLKTLNIDNIFLALGNHDIETCNILNKQLNYSLRDNLLPGTYYNVVYTESSQEILNIIVIDTNLFDDEPLDCNGNIYSENSIKNQIDWFKNTLESSKAKYNIVIGHIPYKAIGHKYKARYIYNKGLNPVFDIIKANRGKVQAYFCADEHNQQFLYDIESDCYLVVVGSGGTKLDKLEYLTEKDYIELGVKNVMEDIVGREQFGFSFLHFDKDKGNLSLNLVDIENNIFEVLI
jgi:hypothetical protein